MKIYAVCAHEPLHLARTGLTAGGSIAPSRPMIFVSGKARILNQFASLDVYSVYFPISAKVAHSEG